MLTQLQFVQDVPHVDHELLDKLRRLMDPEAFRAVLESFLDRSKIHIGNAERCLSEGDLEKLKYTVHSIKGSSANVGMSGLSQLCAEMEQQIKQGASTENLNSQFDLLRAEFDASRGFLISLVQELPKVG